MSNQFVVRQNRSARFISRVAAGLLVSAAIGSAVYAGNLTITNTSPTMTVGTNVPDFNVTVTIETGSDVGSLNFIDLFLPAFLPDIASDNGINVNDTNLSYTSTDFGSGVAMSRAAARQLRIAFTTSGSAKTGDTAFGDRDSFTIQFSTGTGNGGVADSAGTADPSRADVGTKPYITPNCGASNCSIDLMISDVDSATNLVA
jgi:hypothetical protein